MSAMGECLNKPSLTDTRAFEALCKWLDSGVGGMTIQLELGVCHFAAAALLMVCVGLLLAKKLLAKKRVYVLDFAVHKPHER